MSKTQCAVVLSQRCRTRVGPAILPTALLGISGVRAQDIDKVVSTKGRKPFTFLDEIDYESERAAFLRLYREREPAHRIGRSAIENVVKTAHVPLSGPERPQLYRAGYA